MKILALERPMAGAVAGDFTSPLLRAEARRVWELQQSGVLREIHFRQDRREAVLVLEEPDAAAASATLATLPLAAAGLIGFEVIPLVPYDGLARLFDHVAPAPSSPVD